MKLIKQSEIEKFPEVSTFKPFDSTKSKNFSKNGPFSEVIFGPVRDYKCSCGKYNGHMYKGITCDICGVKIRESDVRRKTVAKIKLPFEIVNPIFLELFCKYYGEAIKKLVLRERRYIFDEEHCVLIQSEEDGDAGVQFFKSIYLKLKYKSDKFKTIVEKYKDDIFMNYIVMLPPNLRPMYESEGELRTDRINSYYKTVLTSKEAFSKIIIDETTIQGKEISNKQEYTLQDTVIRLYKCLKESLSKKDGFIRQHLLASRIDFSARAVIVPDYNLKINDCILPFKIAKELFKFHLSRRLSLKFKDKNMYEVMSMIIDSTWDDVDIRNELISLCRSQTVLLNRQPTLHRPSMQAFRISSLTKDYVIKIHPLICEGFNADFDGDTFACYLPSSISDVQLEVQNMLSEHNIFSAATGDLQFSLRQDMVIGLNSLTYEEPNMDHIDDFDINKLKSIKNNIISIIKNISYELISKTIRVEGIVTTFGRMLYNYIISDYTIDPNNFVNEPQNRNSLKKMCIQYYNDHDENLKTLSTLLDLLMKISFDVAAISPVSLAIEDFAYETSIDKETLANIDSIDNNTIIKMFEDDIIEMEKHFNEEKGNIYKIVGSGARGSMDQCQQISLRKGFVANADGTICTTPIMGNLLNGLTPDDIFTSSYGARKGVIDKALNTAKSGYMARKLSFVTNGLELQDVDDCGTERTIPIDVDGGMARDLIFRWHVEDGQLKYIDETNFNDLIGKKIHLRSILGCKKPACKTCYGDLYKFSNSEYIGIIAAQTVSEPATQLTMRTFHTAGAASVTSIDIPDCCVIEDELIIPYESGELVLVGDEYHIRKRGDTIGTLEAKYFTNPQLGYFKKKAAILTLADIMNEDIVNSMTSISNILDKEVECETHRAIDVAIKLHNIYLDNNIHIHLTHLELIVYQQLYYKEDDDKIKVDYDNWCEKPTAFLIQSKHIPHLQSPILGLAYEDINRSLQNMVLQDDDDSKKPILEKLITRG